LNRKLTNRTVLAIGSSNKVQVYWDIDIRGFGLKVTPAGSKVYVVQYRMGGRGARTQRYTIGRHGSPWDAATARSEAKRILQLVGSGIDPRRAEKERQRKVIDLRSDAYIESFIEIYMRRNWKERTIRSHESNFRRWVMPHLGSIPLSDVTRRDLTSIFDQLPPDSPALPRNLFNLIRRLFNWAVERGDIEVSPMRGMRAPIAAPSRQRVLSDNEIIVIAACAEEVGPGWGPFFRTLILTGQRRTEVAEMTWDEVDRSLRIWSLPLERIKNGRSHNVPLSDLVVGELDAIANGDAWPREGYVFTHTGESAISGFSKAKKRLNTIAESMNLNDPVMPWRLHDLRRTLATNMQKLGIRFEVIEAILNHVSITQAGVAGVYMRHDWADEKREALEAWSDWLKQKVLEYQS